MKIVDFGELKGEVITRVEGLEADSTEVKIVTASGRTFLMNHVQD